MLTRRAEAAALAAAHRRHEDRSRPTRLGRAWTPRAGAPVRRRPGAPSRRSPRPGRCCSLARDAADAAGPTRRRLAGRLGPRGVSTRRARRRSSLGSLLIVNVRAGGALRGDAGPAVEPSEGELRRGWTSRPGDDRAADGATAGPARRLVGPDRAARRPDEPSRTTAATAGAEQTPCPGTDSHPPRPGRRHDRRPRAAADRHLRADRRDGGDRLRRRGEDARPLQAARRPRLRRVLPARHARQRRRSRSGHALRRGAPALATLLVRTGARRRHSGARRRAAAAARPPPRASRAASGTRTAPSSGPAPAASRTTSPARRRRPGRGSRRRANVTSSSSVSPRMSVIDVVGAVRRVDPEAGRLEGGRSRSRRSR